MEAAAGVTAVRGGSLPMPSPSSQSARKEWRAVSENSVRSASSEDLERSKLGQSDERTIYEGTGPLNVDYCSITIDGSSDNDLLQQRLHSISRQREELQHVEVELRAQVIARSEITVLQNNFDAQINEHANAVANLKEQLHEREKDIHEMQLKIEEKDRELRAAKIDNEAAWAKEDLLREQNKELASFRRERDNSEAERGQNLQQIHDLKEHIQEKERQYLELEEQHRVAQEAILYRDEQLREAQAWIARVQEMEALQQAEMRDRVEQLNQFWLNCQRQFADMERHHLQTVQQLQLELSESRERSGIYTDESSTNRVSPKEASTFESNKVTQSHIIEDGAVNMGALPNGSVEDLASYSSADNTSAKTDRVSGVPIVHSSLYGVGAYASPGQVTALHSFVMHQQGVPPSVPSPNLHVPQTHVGHFQSMAAMQSHPHWQNQQNQQQQVVLDGSQMQKLNHYQVLQTEQNHLGAHGQYDFNLSANGHILQPSHLDSSISQEPSSVVKTSADETQVLQPVDRNDMVTRQMQQDFHVDSQFPEAFQLVPPGPDTATKVHTEDLVVATNRSRDGQTLATEQPPPADIAARPVNVDANEKKPSVVLSSESLILTENTAPRKVPEPVLLDERSLLACIVRAIPAGSGGQIRISSTLPNRLGKMLAPLHWHDYKKKYGKLDDFVAGHPQLFVIDGDFIHLRDGAQEIISATAAVAKVAAAAAASAPYASSMPSVAVTPMAQSHRLKKVPSVDSKSGKIGSAELPGAPTSRDGVHKPAQNSVVQSQQLNGLSFITHSLSNVKILSKPKDPQELNGMHSEVRPDQPSVHMYVGNGANPSTAGLSNSQLKESTNGRPVTNFGGKQQGRTGGAALMSRK